MRLKLNIAEFRRVRYVQNLVVDLGQNVVELGRVIASRIRTKLPQPKLGIEDPILNSSKFG